MSDRSYQVEESRFTQEFHNARLDQRGDLELVYCDFMKAFDKVPHGRLIHTHTQKKWNNRECTWVDQIISFEQDAMRS